MKKKGLIENKRLLSLIAIGILIAILFFWPSNYYIVSPGKAERLAPMIEIEEAADIYPVEGDIMLTSVSMKRASLIESIYVRLFTPDLVELRSGDFLPPGVDMDEYFDLMQEMMEESQMKAKAVALQKAGYETKITGEGAQVVKVLEDSDAYDKLQVDDIIVAIDDQPVELLTEVINKVQAREGGAEVKVTVERNGEEKDFLIETKVSGESSAQPSIGVLISPYQREYELPIEVSIEAGQIGGPSAGSMFTLEIYNRLTEEDLTEDVQIAGTGTISLEGEVGKIDGVKQKIAAAKEEGADIFFVPVGNQQEVEGVEKEEIEIVIVEDIDQIISYLEGI
ncbi:PDZ domain-containing protein [Natroniella sulfidigena]|uniref:YlbL family protein n=1 Tax=Natroniella sulfidigena TaxID=723921 RepID=UPI00200A7716|nr:S16 family serine protease [Natroniella sulfidigena]MCK8816939.1 PDZ domain-containing protein [Natroniella sulfidigena]